MSGNVKILDSEGNPYKVSPIQLYPHHRGRVQHDLALLCSILGEQARGCFGPSNQAIEKLSAFSGSTAVMMNNKISENVLFNVYQKKKIGDFDVMVDKDLFEFSAIKEGADLGEYTTIGYKKTHQYHVLLRHNKLNVIHQLDILPVKYVNGEPSSFHQKLCNTSHVEDMVRGIRGCYHKFLLTACVKARTSFDDVQLINGSKIESVNRIPKYTYSVHYGVREAYEQVKGKTYEHVLPHTKPYIDNPSMIAELIFGDPNAEIYSVCGLVRSMHRYWAKQSDRFDQAQKYFDHYVEEHLFRFPEEEKENPVFFGALKNLRSWK